MRKNGFTLIELLAVIVILAIIALIATPIILGIINDARKESQERSIDLYARAAKNAIAKYQLNNTSTPTSFDQLDIEYGGDVVCTTKELHEDGSIYLADCKVNGDAVDYTYGTRKIVYLSEVCNPISVTTSGKYTAGDKYTCTVDPNKPAYTFYVLTTVIDPEAKSVNLIMDSNIRTGGEAVKESNPTQEQKGTVAWSTSEGYTIDETEGPITAMKYLQEATIGWVNTNTQVVSTFNDEKGNEYEMAKIFTVNARMPYYSEVSNVDNTTLYLMDYIDNTYDDYFSIVGRNGVSGLQGYWLLSYSGKNTTTKYAWAMPYHATEGGLSASAPATTDTAYGVRPVINLSI